jgi:hypothetical protein
VTLAQKCSDPKDKIYGLLGLMRHKPCKADYSKSCTDLYVEVVLSAFEHGLLSPPSAWGGTRSDGTPFCNGDWGLSVCRTLLTWAMTFGLTASQLSQAHERLATELDVEWPLLHPLSGACPVFHRPLPMDAGVPRWSGT